MSEKSRKSIRVLMIGSDLTSRGGIASVVKAYYSGCRRDPRGVDLRLLKTCYYKDKGLLSEMCILVKALLTFGYSLLSFRPQVLHIHSSAYISFYRKSLFVLIGVLFGRTIIVHLHASAFDEFFITPNYILRRYIRFVLSKAERVIALCNDWQSKLERKLKLHNVVVLPNPVVLDMKPRKREFMKSGKLRVLFLGFLIESKGLRDVITVAKAVKRGGDAIKLVVVGKGELEPLLRESIKEYELEGALEFRGWVEGEAKDMVLREADVFFLPSYNEGMPIAILEAMKFGLPIISTNIAGIPDEVDQGKNGYLLHPGDIVGFYEALKTFAGDKALLSSMGAASLEKVDQFNVTVIWARLVDIYGTLVQGE